MPRILFVVILMMICSLGCDGAPKRKPKKTLGQAVALTAEDWHAWTQFILKEKGPRMYVLIMLTGMFALRAGEAAMLRRSDLMLDMTPPRLNIPKEKGRGKSPGQVPIMPEQIDVLRTWISPGVTAIRRKVLNQNGGSRCAGILSNPGKGTALCSQERVQQKEGEAGSLVLSWGVGSCARACKKVLQSVPISGRQVGTASDPFWPGHQDHAHDGRRHLVGYVNGVRPAREVINQDSLGLWPFDYWSCAQVPHGREGPPNRKAK